MPNGLTTLLRRLDRAAAATVSFDETSLWQEGELNRLVAANLLVPCEPANQLLCDECGELDDVALVESVLTPPFAAFIRCSLAGCYQVPVERLQRWQMSAAQVLGVIAQLINTTGSRNEVVHERLWRLGQTRWCGTPWTVYFGRALHRHDSWQVLNQASLPARSLVFISGRRPADDSRIKRLPIIISLDDVLLFAGDQLRFDHDAIERQLSAELVEAPPPPNIRRKGSRAVVIDALRNELEEHLRAARDYANATLDRSGVPKLLPRPMMKDLARRVGTDKSTVSRCFEDPAAGHLRYLWEVAGDLDQLLAAARCSFA